MMRLPQPKGRLRMPDGPHPRRLADPPVVATHDFIVIGSGPAGRRAAIQAAKLGKSVLVIEKGRRVGGVSVHTGTIPSKTLRETVLNLTGWRERGFYGRAYRVKKDIEARDLMMRLHMTLDHEVDVLEHQFARNAVAHHQGHGALPRSAPRRGDRPRAATGRCIRGERILLAVGTRPYRPADVPFNGSSVLDSDEIVEIAAPAAQPDGDRRRRDRRRIRDHLQRAGRRRSRWSSRATASSTSSTAS